MSKPAARLSDLHLCPMQTPAVVPIPHVGGPILFSGEPRVLIGGLPAARVGDFCFCVGPPAPIVLGSFTVLIGGKPAARVGDMTGHGGTIMPPGCPTVLIGDAGGGAGSPAAFTMSAARASGAAFTRTTCASEGGLAAAQGSPLLATGDPTRKSWIEIELVDQHGRPVPYERYRVTPPGGQPLEGFLDAQGFARVGGIDPGTCVVSFPDLDAASWKPEKGDAGRTVAPVPTSGYRPSVASVGLRVAGSGRPGVRDVTVAVAAPASRPGVGAATLRILTPGIGAVTLAVLGKSTPSYVVQLPAFARSGAALVIRSPDGAELRRHSLAPDDQGFVTVPLADLTDLGAGGLDVIAGNGRVALSLALDLAGLARTGSAEAALTAYADRPVLDVGSPASPSAG